MSFKEKISKLFLEIEGEAGITRMNDIALSALCRAIHDFREKGEEDFLEQFYDLFVTVKNTQPRIALIIDDFYTVWNSLLDAKEEQHPEGHLYWERKIIESIRLLRKSSKESRKKIVSLGASQVKRGDMILIHGISRTVLEILVKAKQKRKSFHVIVAEQEVEKTQQLIEILIKNNIKFQVVPEYMLSHIESDITKVFLGAVTINSQLNMVADAGTNAIVSEFHLRKTPIYLFLSTRKFSLWKSRESHHTYKVKNIRTYSGKNTPISFERIKFSHDRVPLKFITSFITEHGKMNTSQIEKLYLKKFHERRDWRIQFFDEKE